MGRPSEYQSKFNKQAYRLCLLGAKDSQIADFFEVSESTLNNWKLEHPRFLESIKRGKLQADSQIAASLFHRAKGYSHAEDKIFQFEGRPVIVPTVKHYPPDTPAAIFWLKNRQRQEWRDRQEIASDPDQPFSVVIRRTVEPK